MIDLIVHLIASIVDEISDKKRGGQRPPPRRPGPQPSGGTTGRPAATGGTRLNPDLARYGLDIDAEPVSQRPPVTTPAASPASTMRPVVRQPRAPAARQPLRQPARVQSARQWLRQSANLRRAIVAKEILDPPMALRDE